MPVIKRGFLLRQKDLGTTLVLLPILSETDRVLSPNAGSGQRMLDWTRWDGGSRIQGGSG
jgi:hypothetical protein